MDLQEAVREVGEVAARHARCMAIYSWPGPRGGTSQSAHLSPKKVDGALNILALARQLQVCQKRGELADLDVSWTSGERGRGIVRTGRMEGASLRLAPLVVDDGARGSRSRRLGPTLSNHHPAPRTACGSG